MISLRQFLLFTVLCYCPALGLRMSSDNKNTSTLRKNTSIPQSLDLAHIAGSAGLTMKQQWSQCFDRGGGCAANIMPFLNVCCQFCPYSGGPSCDTFWKSNHKARNAYMQFFNYIDRTCDGDPVRAIAILDLAKDGELQYGVCYRVELAPAGVPNAVSAPTVNQEYKIFEQQMEVVESSVHTNGADAKSMMCECVGGTQTSANSQMNHNADVKTAGRPKEVLCTYWAYDTCHAESGSYSPGAVLYKVGDYWNAGYDAGVCWTNQIPPYQIPNNDEYVYQSFTWAKTCHTQ